MNSNVPKLIEALRSGKYKQTRRALHDENGYCCLGVACEVAIENGVSIKRLSPSQNRRISYTYNGESAILPSIVQEYFGFNDNNGGYEYDGSNVSLTDDNDWGKTFDEIADIIESEPEGMFE